MNDKLVAACQMFLIPVTILFGALGAASTEQLKTLISVMGIATSGIWLWRVWVWADLPGNDWTPTVILAALFTLAWIISAIVHARLWAIQRGNLSRPS
jgi:hypothetical protein